MPAPDGREKVKRSARTPSSAASAALFASTFAALSACALAPARPVVLALGPERGWGPADRAALRAHGFTLVHLGPRVLRSETAVVSALTLVRTKLGLI